MVESNLEKFGKSGLGVSIFPCPLHC